MEILADVPAIINESPILPIQSGKPFAFKLH